MSLSGWRLTLAQVSSTLPDYRVISAVVLADCRRFIVETDQPPGRPTRGVVASRRKERRFQRIPASPDRAEEVLRSKYRLPVHRPGSETWR
jgi:hypothetical protein